MVERERNNLCPKFDRLGLGGLNGSEKDVQEIPLKIFHVDDSRDVTDMMEITVDSQNPSANISYRSVNEGKKALEKLPQLIKEGNVNIIFLDWMIPDVMGDEVAMKIKRIEEAKEIPVLMLTSGIYNPDFPKKEDLEEIGVDAVFDKFDVGGNVDRLFSVSKQAILRKRKILEEQKKAS